MSFPEKRREYVEDIFRYSIDVLIEHCVSCGNITTQEQLFDALKYPDRLYKKSLEYDQTPGNAARAIVTLRSLHEYIDLLVEKLVELREQSDDVQRYLVKRVQAWARDHGKSIYVTMLDGTEVTATYTKAKHLTIRKKAPRV